jgi:ankyrin repeat protein
VDVVRSLLEAGGAEQLQAKGQDGMLPMHAAAQRNRSVDVARTLLEAGGAEQLQAKGQDGMLPMHYAAEGNSSVDVIQLLLEAGGAEQLQAKDQDDMLPMHYAAEGNSSVDVLRLLLGRGSPRHASVDRVSGQSIVLAAVNKGNEGIAESLLEAGVAFPQSEIRQLPQRFRETVERVSVSSVLSSYLSDNISLLGAAVRPLQSFVCLCTSFHPLQSDAAVRNLHHYL